MTLASPSFQEGMLTSPAMVIICSNSNWTPEGCVLEDSLLQHKETQWRRLPHQRHFLQSTWVWEKAYKVSHKKYRCRDSHVLLSRGEASMPDGYEVSQAWARQAMIEASTVWAEIRERWQIKVCWWALQMGREQWRALPSYCAYENHNKDQHGPIILKGT